MASRMILLPHAVIDHQGDGSVVIRHDARHLPLPDESVDLIVTSPPYFALRSYRDDDGHYDGQIGSEDTPEAFLQALDECMVEWWRVLKPGGSCWVNLGDKYAGGGGQWEKDERPDPGRRRAVSGKIASGGKTWGMRPKSLMGLPWRFAIRQIDAGWILRAEVVWSKPNGLPESVTDRVRRSHEQWFHLTKEPRYFSAVDEVREPHTGGSNRGRSDGAPPPGGKVERLVASGDHGGNYRATNPDLFNPLGRLPGSVWTVPTEPLIIPDEIRELHDLPDHFAAFPQELPRRIILGWSPSGVCVECGEGRRPVVSQSKDVFYGQGRHRSGAQQVKDGASEVGWAQDEKWRTETTITGYACACPQPDAPTRPAVILDPFGGTGTVAGVARTLGRYGIHNDLSAAYNRLAAWRIWESGHFTKTTDRTWRDRQETLL
jgi:DNA modification methylase